MTEIFDENMTEEFDNVLSLTDEEGNELQYELVDAIEYEGAEYAVLLPLEDTDNGEAVILAVEVDEEGMENFYSVDDVKTLEAVYEIFKDHYKDVFNFED